ncbi:hypothetical protein H8M03_08340 [Sphingomonas sabuli]|uniref:Uncharacterized protein n=1 Tax=Sphingomonas sabuli TaxID=2764186 RepID=A0A7G9L092_9SPHN|nr:hypothetical protein [Sphingomonas sabuli]QNM82041.1 hypothetical protein H8M03_08340 [Sphingomonas sabuli]
MKRFWISVVVTAVAGLGLATAAPAYSAADAQAQATPKGWNYEIKGGKRVPKGDRVTKADGSWREEMRHGKCVTVKEKTATGEYRESRRCDD